jgi:tetratricopeptide (TPR) repeat protein
MMERLRQRVAGLVDAAESAPVTPGRWMLALASIIVLRHFLEQVAGERPILYFLSYVLHYPLAYVAPLIGLSVVLAAFSRERIERVLRLMLLAWALTLLPPVVDMILQRGESAPDIIGYLIPRSGTLWQAFLNLWNPAYREFQGPTMGIRVESLIGCALAALYVHLKTRSALRSVLAFVAVYATMFFFFALPPLVTAAARVLGAEVGGVRELFFTGGAVQRGFAGAPPFALSDLSTALVDVFVIVPLLAVVCRMADRERFREVLGRFDPVEAGLHGGLVVLGMLLARSVALRGLGLPAFAHPFDALALAGLVAAGVFVQPAAAAFAAAGGGRGEDGAGRARAVADGAALFTIAALFAACVSYAALTYVFGVAAAYALYHARPFALSRVAPVGGLLLGAAALFLIELGYSAYTGAAAALWMPRSIVAAAVLLPAAGLAVLRSGWASAPAARRAVRATALAVVAGVAVWGAFEHPGLRRDVTAASFAAALREAREAALAETPAASSMSEGVALLQRGDYEGAVAAFRRAAEEDPEHAPACLGAGAAYARLGRASEAARAYRRALALDPESTKARIGLAEAFMIHARSDSAVAVLQAAVEKDPSSAEAAYTLACVYLGTGEVEKETAMLQRAVAVDPGHGVAHDRLGDIHMSAGRYEDAAAAYKAALLGRTPVRHAHSKLANAYHALGDLDAAVAEMRKEVQASPRMASPHGVLAGLLAEQGRVSEARSEFETALSLTKDEELRAVFRRELAKLGR